MNKENDDEEKGYLRKSKSKEKESFFSTIVMKLSAICIIILIILVITYGYTLSCGKDALASDILDIVKVLVGAIFGGIIAQAALNR